MHEAAKPVFKAKNVPKYKFFEPAHEQRTSTHFKEFRLTMMPQKERKSLSAEKPKMKSKFKARKMPDF